MYIVGQVFVCWLIADFISGFFHWWEDRYAREEWPVLGTQISIPNQLHHKFPLECTKNSYWHRNYTTILPTCLGGLVMLMFFSLGWWLLTFIFLSQSNEFHVWTHTKKNKLIRVLQETGLLISPRQHMQHHKSPFRRCYCSVSCILNPILDAVRFWDGLEWLIYRCSGIQPCR